MKPEQDIPENHATCYKICYIMAHIPYDNRIPKGRALGKNPQILISFFFPFDVSDLYL